MKKSFEEVYLGFDIHMTGYKAGKAVTKLSRSKKSGGLIAVTPLDGGNTVVIGTNDVFSIAKHDNGYYTVLIDGIQSTAMLVDEYGIGNHGCYLIGENVTKVIEPTMVEDAKVIQAISIDDFEHPDKSEFLEVIYEEYIKMLKKGSRCILELPNGVKTGEELVNAEIEKYSRLLEVL